MTFRHILPCLAMLAAPACAEPEAAEPPFEPDPEIAAPATLAGDRFAFDLFRDLAATREGNVTFSPASAEALLHLLRSGAAGSTRAQLDALPLGRQGVASAMRVQSADALFAADGLQLKPTAVEVRRAPFASDPQAAADAVNAWCHAATQGLVPVLVSRLPASTKLVALNAIYLRERWLRPFDEKATQEKGRFHAADGTETITPLMRQTEEFLYAEGADWKAVALFYRRDGRAGEPGCFIGVLPQGDARAFAQGLTVEKFDAIRRALASGGRQRVSVVLPKLDLDSSSFSLKGSLIRLGLTAPFGADADFSGFCDEPLALGDVVQRCRVVATEKETVAAAAAAAIMLKSSLGPRPKSIRFDKPFVWAIGDLATDAPPFFIGLCEKP